MGKFDYTLKSVYKDYLYEGDPGIGENIVIIQIIQILALTLCKAATNPYNFWRVVNFVKDIILDVANAFTPFPFVEYAYTAVKRTLGCISMVFAYFSTELIQNTISALIYSVFSVVCGTMSRFIIEPHKVALQIADNLGDFVKDKVKILTESLLTSYEQLEGPSVDIAGFLEEVKEPVKDVVVVGFDYAKDTFGKSKYGKYVPGSLNPFNYISGNDLTTSLLGMSQNQEATKLLIGGVAGAAIGGSASEYVKKTIKEADIEYENEIGEDDIEYGLQIEEEVDEIDENTDKIIEELSEEAKKRKQNIKDVISEESENLRKKIEDVNQSIVEMLFKGANDILSESYDKVKSKASESLNDAYKDVSKNSIKILSKKIAKHVRQDMKMKIEGGSTKTEYLGYDKKYKMDNEAKSKKEKEQEEKERKEEEETETIINKLFTALCSSVLSILKVLKALTLDQLFSIIKEKSINFYNSSFEFFMNSYKSILQEGQKCFQTLASMNIEIIMNKFYGMCNNITDFIYYLKLSTNVLDCADEMLNIVFTDKKFTIGPSTIATNYTYNKYQKAKNYILGPRIDDTPYEDEQLLKLKESAAKIGERIKEKEKLKQIK